MLFRNWISRFSDHSRDVLTSREWSESQYLFTCVCEYILRYKKSQLFIWLFRHFCGTTKDLPSCRLPDNAVDLTNFCKLKFAPQPGIANQLRSANFSLPRSFLKSTTLQLPDRISFPVRVLPCTIQLLRLSWAGCHANRKIESLCFGKPFLVRLIFIFYVR